MMCIKEPLYTSVCDVKREPCIYVWNVKEPLYLCMECEGTPLNVYDVKEPLLQCMKCEGTPVNVFM